jgi:Uma2 family endonuclease
MIAQRQTQTLDEIIYPERDGNPMSDNTLQFSWITTLKSNLDWLYAQDPLVFVAGDLLWYPVEGDNKTRQAPDVMVVFGRPKGDRGSYQQWREENIPPQVVFEILSPGNTPSEMMRKLLFYQRYGVEEYYIYDPQKKELSGCLRKEKVLEEIENLDNWLSPRLGIRFSMTETGLELYYPDSQPFTTYTQEREKAQREQARAQREREKAQREQARAEMERERAEKLAAKLRELGINPEQL